MDRTETTLYAPTSVPHPGELVAEYLSYNGWSQSDLARRTGLTRKTVSSICNGNAPISTKTALLFEKTFQRPAQLWLGMQRQFDEMEARNQERACFNKWGAWAQEFPVQEMRKLQFSLPAASSDTEALLGFFGVASPDGWNKVWKKAGIAYRQCVAVEAEGKAMAAWVRETELVASRLELNSFDRGRLLNSLHDLRSLTRGCAETNIEPVQQVCARAGVAVVRVPKLRNTGISGCARWLGESKALVGLTLRYKSDNQLWFTLFHELGHILYHKDKMPFVVDNEASGKADPTVDEGMKAFEEEANRFAADNLSQAQA